ncbi:tRNA-dihydrouridine(47) synthase [NAD(P)(+)]-like [Pseudolycoriella hygida]|uniref:tRNA-dihydrouridine(47) synthase [NAD(P)(+)] n=1 Tax=Pseudolycoriella hygida TaxID=35572 RepID=A0A9Q0NGB0_9DIPT|nr:tRNA-dihydrouridine(47) synthase [NAD(P)(+)]-like [Pseudolycoriella hygida]
MMDGICYVKKEFLVAADVQPIVPKTNSNTEEILDTSNCNNGDESKTIDDSNKRKCSTSEEQEPKRKKWEKKNRGQNKARHQNRFQHIREHNLCKSLFNGHDNDKKCPFEKCKYVHDIHKYLESKPKDVDGTCYIYSTKGFCERGLTCRFSGGHLDENLNNLKADFYNPDIACKTKNQISYDLQVTLRKRNYNFDLSKKILAEVDAEKKQRKENEGEKPTGFVSDTDIIKERPSEKKSINFREKLFLSPLTTVGNLPFRRICKEFGADVTCGEMACAVPICNGISQEWALVKRHESEDLFGVQLCANNPQLLTFACQLLKENAKVDFIDLNIGCPIELIYGQGAGSALIRRPNVLEIMVRSSSRLLGEIPFTVKTRTGVYSHKSVAHELVPKFEEWGASCITIHGRSKEQRYTKRADWEYIEECASKATTVPVIGNGDILNFEEYNTSRLTAPSISGVMIGRGALIKPWLFKEIKEQKHWDPSSSERFEIMKKYVNYGLEHWGSDTKGVENTRRFFLEWQSFLYRYVPYGLLERPPQRINDRPEAYFGRDDLETLMASSKCSDWIKLSEMFLGPVPEGHTFLPKHKANSF